MFDPAYVVTIVAPFVLFYVYCWWTYKGPPHLIGAPLVGYMPFLGKEPYLVFQDAIEKHGPIFSLYMGSLYAVVLGTYDVIHEAYIEKGNVFNSRHSYNMIKVYDHETAFLYIDGENWKVTRNFTMNTLKSMGFGKNYTKNFVQAEIQEFINTLKQYKGEPVNIEGILRRSTNMLILSLLTGKKCDRPNDTKWIADVSSTAATLMKSYTYNVIDMYPWLRKIPFVSKFIIKKHIRTLKDRLWELLEEEMESSKKTLLSSSEPENFIHSWYLEQERRNSKDDPQKHLFSDFNLKNNLDVLIQGSSDTTSTTLIWAFLYLLIHPDIQEKLHMEIDEQIGRCRPPCLEDNAALRYTRAFLMEVHRAATIVPLGAFHSNKVKGTIKGYEIPKDTVIITDFWGVHHDPKYFAEPFNFDPERFLDEDTKFRACEYIDPFSFGRRQCPGKQVAEIQIFLYLVSILQVFELRSPPGSMPSDKGCVYDKTLIRHPVLYELVFCERNA